MQNQPLCACALPSQFALANITVSHDASIRQDIGDTILINSEIKKSNFADFQRGADRIRFVEKDVYKAVPRLKVELDGRSANSVVTES